MGVDYNINKKNIIGVVLTGNAINRYSPLNNIANIKNKFDNLISTLKSGTTNDDIDQNLSANINYKGVLDTSGTELNIDLDYAHYPAKNKQYLQTNAFDINNNMVGTPLVLDGQFFSFIRIYAAKADVAHSFKNNLKLEAGLKTSLIKSNNILDYLRQQGTT